MVAVATVIKWIEPPYPQCKKRSTEQTTLLVYQSSRAERSIRPFAKVMISPYGYFVELFFCKSGGNAVGIVGIIVVVTAIVIDHAEIVVVIRIRRANCEVAAYALF